MTNPYDVERSFPDYFLEHRELTIERQGTYRCGEHPIWTVHHPLGLLGNAIIIEGESGLIVYDTGCNLDAGAKIAEEIRAISPKPVRAVFYSHHHADHFNGTSAFVDPAAVAAGQVAIYAWENFSAEKENEFGDLVARQSMGLGYYGGAFLAPEDQHHHGIGLLPTGGASGYLPATHVLSEDQTLVIEGVEIRVFYTGGEAISEFGLHLPAFDCIAIADEFFTGLANLHTIRGSKPRVPDNYLAALQRVLDIGPEWLVGSHIEPIQGRDLIAARVTRYRDAIKYLWDQTVRLINKGYTPTELQHALKDLPEEVVDPPYTVPLYGTPSTMVPEFFTGWVSWFSGDSTELFPSAPGIKEARLTELMGGVDRVLDAAKSDHAAGEHQLAAELAQIALRADPENQDAKLVKAAALRARGYQEINPIARSWYLTGALELEGRIDPGLILRAYGSVLDLERTVTQIVAGWRYLLDADAAKDVRLAAGIVAADTGEETTVRIRNRVLETTGGIDDDVTVVVRLTHEQARGDGTPVVLAGDPDTWAQVQGLLDRGLEPFYMHMR
ncbi:alkyl sulfatase dimerization domain-containing protein [Nocardioides sp. GXZ039]|uniref:alkyl sulfatase dimerization domain-containing protein n=1 Tax=Nocardioides sp. GXZ039 TaxID=3136018 RepID=UPI0030F3A38B